MRSQTLRLDGECFALAIACIQSWQGLLTSPKLLRRLVNGKGKYQLLLEPCGHCERQPEK